MAARLRPSARFSLFLSSSSLFVTWRLCLPLSGCWLVESDCASSDGALRCIKHQQNHTLQRISMYRSFIQNLMDESPRVSHILPSYTSTISLFISFVFCFSFTNISLYYFVCAIGGQHDGHLPFCLPGFVKLVMLLLHVLVARCWNKYTRY